MSNIARLHMLAEILGTDRIDVKRGLQAAALDYSKIDTVHKHFLLKLKKEGYDLSDLPVFSVGVKNKFQNGISPGNIVRGNRICEPLNLPVRSFNPHCLMAAQTDIGKSTLIKIITPTICKAGPRMIFFDMEDQFKDLLNVLPPGELIIMDIWNDRDNLLEPPSPEIDPRIWKSDLKNVCREALYLRDGTINLLDDIITKLYEDRGVFEGTRNYPNVIDLVRTLERMNFNAGTRNFGYLETLKNRFKSMLDNMGNMLDCRQGYPVGDMLRKSVVYRIDLSSDLRNFYVLLKLTKAENYRKHHPATGLENIIVIDETHKMISHVLEKRADLGEPMMFTFVRTMRKRGFGFIFSDQSPSKLPLPLLGNINVRFAMRLGHERCIDTMAGAMNLNIDQKEYLTTIQKRYAVLQSGEYPLPVLIKIPDVNFPEISEAEVKRRMDPVIQSLKYVPRVERMVIERTEENAPASNTIVEPPETPDTDPRENRKTMLRDIDNHRTDGLKERYDRLGLTTWKGDRLVKELKEYGFIEDPVTISTGTRGSGRKILTLTKAGAEYIGLDFEDCRLPGKGSIPHRIYQMIIKNFLEKEGKVAFVEYSANGKSVDVASTDNDQKNSLVAYEIEMNSRETHILKNITTDLDSGFDRVVIVSRNKAEQKKVETKVQKKVDQNTLDKVSFKLISEFL